VTIWPRKHKRKTPSQAFTRSKQIYRNGRSLKFCGTVHSITMYFIFLQCCAKKIAFITGDWNRKPDGLRSGWPQWLEHEGCCCSHPVPTQSLTVRAVATYHDTGSRRVETSCQGMEFCVNVIKFPLLFVSPCPCSFFKYHYSRPLCVEPLVKVLFWCTEC